MQKKYDSTIENTPKEKKKVSWNDNQSEGKMEPSSLKNEIAASSTSKILDAKVEALVKEGYTPIEAAALVGRAIARSKSKEICIINNPIFYKSVDEIRSRKLLRDQTAEALKNEEQNANPYGFFSSSTIKAGIAIAFVATIGMIAARR